MARGTTLGELVRQLRIAAKLDPNEALSLNLVEPMKEQLRKEQERLYDEFDWPFLKVTTDKHLASGQRYYDLPTNINLERVLKVDVKWGTEWLPVERGIELCHYSLYDSDLDDRQSPIQRWDVRDTGSGEQIEVWPIPNENYNAATGDGTLRFTGIRKLNSLIAESDVADLDDAMIVDFCAAERLLAKRDGESAKMMFNRAKSRLEKLSGRSTKNRRGSFGLGSDASPDPRRQPRIIVAKSPS